MKNRGGEGGGGEWDHGVRERVYRRAGRCWVSVFQTYLWIHLLQWLVLVEVDVVEHLLWEGETVAM